MELQQSPFLTLISNRKVRQAMALMGQPKEARLTPEAAEQVCERTDSAAVLEGSIASVGSQYVLVRSSVTRTSPALMLTIRELSE